jgi:PTH1 family peptidyl-tRNA hydrolase
MEEAFLIVGLGNPGADYAQTRHNAGFMLVEDLAARWKADWAWEAKFTARLAAVRRPERLCLLCQPQTFMNVSGEAVAAVVNYYRLQLERLLVVVDDSDLPLGAVRMRPGGSSGGHHGLDSIERQLSTRGYARLRLGIGRRAEDPRQLTGYVLAKFDPAETVIFEKVLDRAGQQVVCWLEEGIEAAMNRFNGVVEAAAQQETEKEN